MGRFPLIVGIVLGTAVPSLGETPTKVLGTRIGLVPPTGFSRAQRFPGFFSEETGASIMVSEVPAPPSETLKGFTREGLAKQGMTFLKQEDVPYGPHAGRLFSVTQEAQGRRFKKEIWAFGEGDTTFVVTAAWPSEGGDELAGALHRAVLSARVVSERANPAEALTFDVTPAGDLGLARIMGNNVILSRGGVFPSRMRVAL